MMKLPSSAPEVETFPCRRKCLPEEPTGKDLVQETPATYTQKEGLCGQQQQEPRVFSSYSPGDRQHSTEHQMEEGSNSSPPMQSARVTTEPQVLQSDSPEPVIPSQDTPVVQK